jgi:hypothetical protein
MFFLDDQIANIQDIQTAFPSSTCILIDPRPVKRDVREFQGNPYFHEMAMNRGFQKEHMTRVSHASTLVLDWDKTLSVVEGIRMPWSHFTFEDTGMRIEDVCHVILGGHARIALLRSFFKRVKANIIVLTNNPSACPVSEVPHVFGDDPNAYNRPQFLRLIRFIIPTFQERNLIASHMYGGIKSVALKDYFKRRRGTRRTMRNKI